MQFWAGRNVGLDGVVLRPWSMVLGPLSLVPGPWSLVTGTWSMVPGTGTWSMVVLEFKAPFSHPATPYLILKPKSMWRIVPKMHMMCHCLEDCVAVSGNPRSSWCYCDESEIGAARRVAEASHPSTLSCAVIDKHRLG